MKTREEIRKRHYGILEELDKIEAIAAQEERSMTEAEGAKYDALLREDSRLQIELQGLLSEAEMEKYRERKSKGEILREFLSRCVKNRANDSTILLNATDDNEFGNIEASGAIPLTINELIDTKVAGLELPDDLKVATGVVGMEITPYCTDDVQFSVAGEVEQVSEQNLNFDKVKAEPERVAASVAVSHRAVDNTSFDLLGFISYKLQKGLAKLKALHVYSHCQFTNALQSPFANVDVEDVTLDENVGKAIAAKAAELYDKGFEGVPYIVADKATEVELSYTKAIPGAGGDRTVVEDGKCVGYPLIVSPYVGYSLVNGVPTKSADKYLAIGHFGYLAMQQHGEVRFNVDASSSANFDKGTIVVGLSLDLSLTELSSKVNGNKNGKPQAFKLLRLVSE